MIINLSIIDHPNMRHTTNSNGLYTVQVIHNGQTMKAERTILEMIDILEAEAVRSTMRDFKTGRHLLMNIYVRSEYIFLWFLDTLKYALFNDLPNGIIIYFFMDLLICHGL